ncbi:MAG: TrkA family potassium uptake protein [Pelolinea sp.]|nr:TrkA family potassium uptake protein [Pelolinea sp.]
MKVIIIGCGRLGSGLARDLKMRGNQVVVIDRDPLAFERLGKGFEFKTITGIGFDRDVLIEAGIEKADALAAVMESDEANVVAARIAKQVFRVPRVAARIYDPLKADIYRRLGIPTISPVAISSARMSELLTFSGLSTLTRLGGGGVSIVEIDVTNLLAKKTISALDIPGKVVTISITRNGTTFMPTQSTVLEFGDMVHLAVTEDHKDRLAELLA